VAAGELLGLLKSGDEKIVLGAGKAILQAALRGLQALDVSDELAALWVAVRQSRGGGDGDGGTGASGDGPHRAGAGGGGARGADGGGGAAAGGVESGAAAVRLPGRVRGGDGRARGRIREAAPRNRGRR